jgi:hypothetical protein
MAVKDTLTRAPRVKMANEATLRDYFAARASDKDVSEYRGKFVNIEDVDEYHYEYTREQAKYRYADAMLAAREETK